MGFDFWKWALSGAYKGNLGLTEAGKHGGMSEDQFINDAQAVPGQIGHALGFLPSQADPNAPGGSLDTTQSGEDKQRLAALIAQLQQQAATGEGSWEKTLATGTQNAQNTASAIGQEQANNGGNYQSSLMNIGNAQSMAAQRGVGEGNILRAQSEQGAQDALSGLLDQQGSQDVNQANSAAQANQGIRELNTSLTQQAKGSATGALGAAGSALMSKGGPVPGKPKVFGNDERNDTVPAMLSPGEIVVPRTKARDPAAAAAFAAAIAKHHGKHMADGGGTGINDAPGPSAGQIAETVFIPHSFGGYYDTQPQAPSIENGGLLDTRGADATRTASLGNADLLAQRAAGQGPSVAPQQLTNASDAAIAQALRARGRGPGANDVLAGATAAGAEGGAGAAHTSMEEQQGGTKHLAAALLAQRQNDIALAQSQQQAAFRNTQLNAGLTLQNQAALRGVLAGAGQAATAYSGQTNAPNADALAGGWQDPSASEWKPYSGSGGDEASGPGDFKSGYADGGEVRTGTVDAHRTLDALKADYDAAEAQRAIAKGPDLANRIAAAGKAAAGAMRGAATSASGMVHRTADPPPYGGRGYPDARAQGGAVGYAEGGEAGGGGVDPVAEAKSQWLQSLFGATPSTVREGDVPPGVTGAGGGAPDMGPVGGAGVPPTAAPPVAAPEAPKAPPRKPPEAARAKPSLAAGFEKAGVSPETPSAPAPSPVEGAYQQIGEAQSAEAKAQQGELLKQEEAVAAHQRELRADAEKAAERSNEIMTAGRRIADEMAKADSSIDPGRYWATRTTGQKITGIIGLALGSLGAGPDGVNRAAGMMNEAINRDIDAQKAEHTIRLQRGKQALEGYQSLYAQMRQLTDDDSSAKKLAYAAGQDLVKAKFERFAAIAKDPIARQQAILGAQTASQEAEKARTEAHLKTSEAKFNEARAAKLGGAGTAKTTAGIDAVQRLAKMWKSGGGWSGYITQHIPGTAANDVGDVRQAMVNQISVQLAANGAPKSVSSPENVEKMIPKPGEDTESGFMKLQETLRLLQNQKAVAPSSGEDLED